MAGTRSGGGGVARISSQSHLAAHAPTRLPSALSTLTRASRTGFTSDGDDAVSTRCAPIADAITLHVTSIDDSMCYCAVLGDALLGAPPPPPSSARARSSSAASSVARTSPPVLSVAAASLAGGVGAAGSLASRVLSHVTSARSARAAPRLRGVNVWPPQTPSPVVGHPSSCSQAAHSGTPGAGARRTGSPWTTA